MGKKKLLSLALFCGVLSFSSMFALADTGSESVASTTADSSVLEEDGYTYEVDVTRKTATITGYVGEETELVIPETIGGYKVTTIGGKAFYQNSNITSVTFPSTITKIGANAFCNCSNLSEIKFTEGTEDAIIEQYAFYKTIVTDITIPGNYKKIEMGAFYQTNLTSIVYEASDSKEPDQIIESRAFDVENGLGVIEVMMSSSVSSIHEDAFDNKYDVLKFIGVVGNYAWEYANKCGIDYYEGIGVSNEYRYYYIGDKASISCYLGSQKSLDIPASIDGYKVNKIDDYAFSETDISSVVLPSTITKIGEKAFYRCDSLKTVELNEGTEDAVIEEDAFCYTSIKNITIPGNYKKIGVDAFWYCGYLTEVVYEASTSDTTDQVIEKGAFGSCQYLKRVTLSSSIAHIEEDAFKYSYYANLYGDFNEYIISYGKKNDVDCVTGSGITDSGYSYDISFGKAVITGYVGNEESLVIPSTLDGYKVEKIEPSLFEKNKKIRRVVMPEGLKIIGERAFYESYIEEVDLPSTITKIGSDAFCYCYKLKTLNLKKGVDNAVIYDHAFKETAIASLNIPANYFYIDSNAFNGCKNLKKVVFESDGIERKGNEVIVSAFCNCPALETAVIPDTITGLPEYTAWFVLFDDSQLITIYGNSGSAIEAYAKDWSIPFVAYENTSVLKSDVSPVAVIGDSVKLDASASTGYGELKYKFIMHNKDTNKWTALTGYTTNSSYTWMSNILGNVEFFVNVKDETGLVTTSNAVTTNIKSELANLEFTATPNKTHLLAGETLKIDVDVTSGEEPYTYRYIVHNKKTDVWFGYDDGEFVERNYIIWEATSIGSREFFVEVKDVSGRIVRSAPININVYEPITGEFTINDKTIGHNLTVGDNISFKADSVSGGSGGYTYKFVMHDVTTNGWVILRDYESANTFAYTLETLGDKEFYLFIKDSVENKVTMDCIKVSVAEVLRIKSTVDKQVVAVGDTVKINAEASGGYGNYTYSYLIYNPNTNQWFRFNQKFTTENVYACKVAGTGIREFYVEVKDNSGNVIRSKAVEVNIVELLETKININNTYVIVGDKVEISANVTGGYGPYTYTYKVYNETTKKWGTLKSGTTSNEHTWKAGSAGTRVFYVEVTDATGKVVRSEGVTVVTAPKLSVSAAASIKTTVVGDKVKFTATATGGSGSYKYSYIVYNKTTGKWARLKDEILSNTYTWMSKSEGTRVFYVEVTDSNGKTVRSEGITVTTKENVPEVVLTATKSSVSAGASIKLTATATGGKTPYTYSFLVYNFTTKKWYRFNEGEFLESNTKTWKASGTGKRKFFVEVTDSNGKTVRSEGITITVK